MRPCFTVPLLLCAILAAAPLAASPLPSALELGESRPLETAIGDTAIAPARGIWLDLLRGAQKSVDLEEFYFSHRPGEALQPVVDEIGRAAARGVHVRLLLDAGMARTYPQPADSLAKLPNVQVRRIDYHRIAGGVQHSKYFVVDGREAWLGSQNLDWRSFAHIHELGVRIRDARIAGALAAVFDADWALADTSAAHAPPPPVEVSWPVKLRQGPGHEVEAWLGANPRATTPAGIPWDRDLVVQRIESARTSIVVQTLQYGVRYRGGADSTLHRALIAAATRGVDVRLIVSDWSLGGGNEPAMRDLAAHGVHVRISRLPEWSGGYIPFARVEHCKYMAVDGEWAWIGTSNWEPGYFLDTRNVGLTVHDPAIALELARVFRASWEAPSAVDYGPDTHLPPRAHGEQAPPGEKMYGE